MRILAIILLCTTLAWAYHEEDFKAEQLEHTRVESAYDECWPALQSVLQSKNITPDSFDVLIRIFKFEEDLELWAKNRDSAQYQLISTYKFCSNVGLLGPKRRQGDLQIPEGYYHISKFNPESNYHLSLKINYPNKADSLKRPAMDKGGMIFIHGGCSTIGCVPITDKHIKDVYIACMEAQHTGQLEIPVHMYPARLTDENMNRLESLKIRPDLIHFWKVMKTGYDLFEQNQQDLPVRIDQEGDYNYLLN